MFFDHDKQGDMPKVKFQANRAHLEIHLHGDPVLDPDPHLSRPLDRMIHHPLPSKQGNTRYRITNMQISHEGKLHLFFGNYFFISILAARSHDVVHKR